MGDATPSTPGSMAIANYKKQESSLKEFKVPVSGPKKKRKPTILSEEKYIEELGKIIQRDFFPDLEKLKAQNEYLEAEARNDFNQMAAIRSKYSGRKPTERSGSVTPSTFETPLLPSDSPFGSTKSTPGNDTPCSNISGLSKSSSKSKKSLADNHSLDSFLQKYTSEDNQSFEEIIETAEEKLRQKFAVLYHQEKLSAEQLARALTLPSIEAQFDKPDPAKAIETWSYTNKNSIMYIPDGVELTREEQIQAAANKMAIKHPATRLAVNPFNDESSKKSVNQIAEKQSQAMCTKIGVDGHVLNNPNLAAEVKGYNLLATPSPRPGEDFTPIMTWGEIEGTPFLLDGSDTPRPSNSGPSFRINESSRRETIAFKLAEKAGEKMRAQKQKALDAARNNMNSPFIRSNMERLASMSPAARRLASAKLGLRSPSLTPTPSTLKSKPLNSSFTPTPILSTKSTPASKSNSSLGVVVKTPNINRIPATPGRSLFTKTKEGLELKTGNSSTSTLTDDLLKIPSKRMRAMDFF